MVLPESMSEKVFVIDKNEDVIDLKDGARGGAATVRKSPQPFVIPASVIDFTAVDSIRPNQLKSTVNIAARKPLVMILLT